MSDFGVPVLANLLSEADLAAIVALAQRRKYADGDLIHERGDPGVSMGVVVRGHVKLLSPRNNGREYFISLIGPGQNYGDIAIIRQNARDFSPNDACGKRGATSRRGLLLPGALLECRIWKSFIAARGRPSCGCFSVS